MNIFRGRADALMATDERYLLADKNLSELTGGSPPRETAEQSSDHPNQAKAPASSADSEAVPFRLTPAALDLTPLSTVPEEESRNVDFGEVERSTLVDLPIAAFTQECENLVKNKKDEWEAATANDARALVRIFTGVLQEHNVAHSGQITQYHIGRLRQHLNDIPTRWGQSSQLRALSTGDLRKRGLQMRADAEASGAKPPVGLSAQTIRKHFANLQTFLQHLRGNGFNILDWTFEGVRPKKPKPGSIRRQQYKPTPADIKPIFSAPIFTGCAGWEERGKSGDVVYHDSLFYMPLLFVYLGARRKELAGLGVNDVYETEDGWVVEVRATELRRIKTIQSHKLLPLPDELIRLNFLHYRTEIKKLGYNALFPDLFSHLTDNDPGDRFYDQFIPVMQQSLGEALWQRSLHALRHGLSNTLKQRGVPPAIIDDLSGRLSDGETNNRYTDVAGISLMRDALAKFPIITDDIQPRDINLLPWVREKQPPPWARPGRK
jgi:integrase